MGSLSHEQIEDLLDYIGVDKVGQWKGDKISFCCPVHGESNPSAGIHADYVPKDEDLHYQVFNCFSCGESGGLAWFLYRSLPDYFRNLSAAEEFIYDRYGVKLEGFMDTDDLTLTRYDHLGEKRLGTRFELPRSHLAPYKSGKETYQYFYDRGFTKETVKRFMIGRDTYYKTVTIPVFWEDGVLAGVIGRYLFPVAKNRRYKVYEFPKSSLVFPLDKYEPSPDGGLILVEGILDAVWMHQLGYANCVATMTNTPSDDQAEWIKNNAAYVVEMLDSDKGGDYGRDRLKKQLKGMQMFHVEYPIGKKDPQQCSKRQIDKMLDGKIGYIRKKIGRL